MDSLPRTGFLVFSLLVGSCFPGLAAAQNVPHASPAQAGSPAAIARVRILVNQDSPAVEITADRPITPMITKLDGPPRLMIDLPNALMSVDSKQIDVQSDRLGSVHLEQYRRIPPTVRVILNLLKPSDYTSSDVGNVLTVRVMGPVEPGVSPAANPMTITRGVMPASVPGSSQPSGAIMYAGRAVATGSSVTAGSDTAVLRLGRGGEVHVCPGTTVSVTTSPSGHDVMLGMSTGGLETQYSLDSGSDSILTPDFRILLAGPGDFHFAFGADSRGNTCVKALPGNTGPLTITELMGDGTYHVNPDEQVMFHSGHLARADSALPPTCGCPPAEIPVMRAAVSPPPAVTDQAEKQGLHVAPEQAPASSTPVPSPESAPLPSQVTVSVDKPGNATAPANANDVRVQVEAPFVFRANEQPGAAPVTPPPIQEAARLPLTYSKPPEQLETMVAPPSLPSRKAGAHKPGKGFFGKIKGFFSSIFH
jgi:hypothetical protein